ncbi:MAG: transglycosylase domain-containing protein, partial [Proteobacteria bacterium]|nr:transglycosylase domain-containing protein [Pseudomonadota bacterium]
MERRWTKREILETYLGFVYLGQGAYGVQAAARAYFDRDVKDLDLAQAALLAGLVQAPGRLDPYRHPDAARARRDEVLARMVRGKLIDEPTRAAAAATPITLTRPHKSYGTRVPWYTEQVRQLVTSALPAEVAKGGLVIETAALPALGTRLQADAIAQAEAWAQKDQHGTLAPEVAAILWDHRTGYVEAIVGGLDWSRDEKLTGSQFDRMRQSCRQPGSAWKPLVYGAGLESGAITP